MEKNHDENFRKSLGKYLKHRNLEIVFTLKNGKRVALNGKRRIIGDEVIQYFGEEKGIIIQVNEIQSADVYAL
ncbi:MAG: hypothetical protein OEV78_01130 [Spirochaetia bacterium]|nr:hypothetical protein [Spirochaetia bacterium]